MNCFNHTDTAAIGTCKACNKGLCTDCATDLGHGIACKNQHEQRVQDLEMIISGNIRAFSDCSKDKLPLMPLFYFAMGVFFVAYPLYQGGSASDFVVLLGAGFIVFSLLLFVKTRRIYRAPTK